LIRGVFILTKITKEEKLKAIIDVIEGRQTLRGATRKYQIGLKSLEMLLAAYKSHGVSVLYNPPQITSEFRVRIASWKISHNATYTEVAAKFGYTGIQQIYNWTNIYREKGPNGLLSITKGRPPVMTKKVHQTKENKKELTAAENRIKQLEAENLELRIKSEALKLIASKKQATKKSPK
jgi:transposase